LLLLRRRRLRRIRSRRGGGGALPTALTAPATSSAAGRRRQLLLRLFVLVQQLLLLGEFDDRRRLLGLGLLLLQADERDVRDFWVDTTGHYQVDDAASPLQDANGRLVRDGRFQDLSVDRQDLIALGQSTISVVSWGGDKKKRKKLNQIQKGSVTFIVAGQQTREDNCLGTTSSIFVYKHTSSLPSRNHLLQTHFPQAAYRSRYFLLLPVSCGPRRKKNDRHFLP